MQKDAKKMKRVLPSHRFECCSGTLYWGSLNNVAAAAREDLAALPGAGVYDGMKRVVSPDAGGTVVRRHRAWRTRAVQGSWLVQPYDLDGRLGGVVAHSASYDPKVALAKACEASVSGHDRVDGEVLVIGRYDQGWHSDCDTSLLHSPDDHPDEPWYQKYFGRHLFLLDAGAAEKYLADVVAAKHAEEGPIMVGDAALVLGVHTFFPSAEYELAWMIYNTDDELVAMVWDSAYHMFQNEGSAPLDVVLGGEVVLQVETERQRFQRMEARDKLTDPDWLPNSEEDGEQDHDGDEDEDEEEDDYSDDADAEDVTVNPSHVWQVGTPADCAPADVRVLLAVAAPPKRRGGFFGFAAQAQQPELEEQLDLSDATACVNVVDLHCTALQASQALTLAAQLPKLERLCLRELRQLSTSIALLSSVAPCLQRLTIDHCELGAAQCEDLARFALSRGLVELCVPNNGIAPEGLLLLLDALGDSRSLQVLDLRNNGLCKAPLLEALGRFLRATRTVHTLLVEQSLGQLWNMGNEGELLVACLAEAMEQNYSVEHLGLPLLPPRLHALCWRARRARDACRDAAVHWLLCRRGAGVDRNVARLVARYVWSTRGCAEWGAHL